MTESYGYGSDIEFMLDLSVRYKNRLMPPGTVIHRWFARTNYQANRVEPSLPLIDGESAYLVKLNIDYNSDDSESLILRIIFYDRYDNEIKSTIVRDKKAYFLPPITTYSYTIELINGGNADFTFKSLVLKEVSKEEFNEDQKRIERLKEAAGKGQKFRRKNKKSK